jgi:hypothetical protein
MKFTPKKPRNFEFQLFSLEQHFSHSETSFEERLYKSETHNISYRYSRHSTPSPTFPGYHIFTRTVLEVLMGSHRTAMPSPQLIYGSRSALKWKVLKTENSRLKIQN